MTTTKKTQAEAGKELLDALVNTEVRPPKEEPEVDSVTDATVIPPFPETGARPNAKLRGRLLSGTVREDY